MEGAMVVNNEGALKEKKSTPRRGFRKASAATDSIRERTLPLRPSGPRGLARRPRLYGGRGTRIEILVFFAYIALPPIDCWRVLNDVKEKRES